MTAAQEIEDDSNKERQQAELLDKIHSLSDLELALLLSLIAREHCLVSTEPDFVEDLSKELCLTAVKTFDLTPVIVPCHSQMTLDEFAAALLVPVIPLSSPLATNNHNNYSNYHTHRSVPSGSGSYFSSKHHNVPGSSSSAHPPPSQQQQQQQQAQATQIANVILAQNLDHAPRAVQIQALELLRTRRLFARTSVHTAPKQFLFVAVVGAESGGQARVTHHLNDFLYLAHWHDPEDGFAYLEEQAEEGWASRMGIMGAGDNNDGDDSPYTKADEYDRASIDSGSSVVKRGTGTGTGMGSMANSGLIQESYHSALSGPGLGLGLGLGGPGRFGSGLGAGAEAAGPSLSPQLTFHSNDLTAVDRASGEPQLPHLSDSEIAHLAHLAQHDVSVDIDVRRYQMNIVAFLRMHRAVGGGVTPQATKHFEQLMRSLAPLHGLDFVTPALVGLAAKKVYLHRIEILASPERERSMQWGSELSAVEAMLEGVGPEEVIEDVLGMVAVPQ